MDNVFISYIDFLVSYDDKFLTILLISFAALIGSLYLFLKSIDDKRNREEYSNIQMIGSSGAFGLNVTSFVLGIIGIISTNENIQFSLFISEMVIISAVFVFLILCFVPIYKRSKIYESNTSWPRESNVGLGLIIFDLIFDILLFIIL